MSRVKEIRLNKGISALTIIELLKEKCNSKLKSKSTYYKKESGHLKFTTNEAIIISEFFDMDIKSLFFDE